MSIERNLVAAAADAHSRVEIYSGVARLAKTVWASEVRESGSPRDTAIMFCHPTANFLGHYALPGIAARGFGAVGLTTRYVGNDSSLLLENCLLDIGAVVRHLREVLGYRHVVLVGNSGGASTAPYYQAQARNPTVSNPPGGGPDLTQADLPPLDGLVMFMAHPSRARLSSEWLDPAITDELRPFDRDASLDMYDERNAPPFTPEFIATYRAAQLERNRRISRWCEEQLVALKSGSGPEGLDDVPFVVHGTCADLRFLDGAIDPSDRPIGVSLWGPPAVANYLPAGIGRFNTARAWLNQWSVDHSLGNAVRWLPDVAVPVLVEYGTADVTVHPHMGQEMHEAAGETSELVAIKGAGHYYEGTPELLEQALDAMAEWVTRRVVR
ncbi:MAG TPA: alpha/beta hydrolase [Mycobacteriales bacterium]|nr:alpha/beta hydrolase [Mycobacteriales bacterium]